MSKNYRKSITIRNTPDAVYKSLTQRIPEWWTEDFEGSSNQLGDVFSVRFTNSFKTIKVTDLSYGRKVTWLCEDAFLDIPGISNKREWVDTLIVWEIDSEENFVTLILTHKGLTPGSECYGVCEQGWDTFLGSLSQLLSNRKGEPYKKNSEPSHSLR